MTAHLELSGPTVTLFGDRDPLDTALLEALALQGFSTHAITTSVGWLGSVRRAVVRLDTATGLSAMRDLSSREAPAAWIVAVCGTADAEATHDLDDLCRRCGDHHDVQLLWHPPLVQLPLGQTVPADAMTSVRLAASVAEAVGETSLAASSPAFASRTFDAHPT